MSAGTIAVVVVGLALVGGGIYLATQSQQPSRESQGTDARTEDLASGSATNPLSAILGVIGTMAGVVRDIRAGDQRTEQMRLGTRQDGVSQRTQSASQAGAFFGGV